MNIVNIEKKMKLIQEHWSPKIVGELNGQYVKLAKLKGEFVWHKHEDEDELFMVIKGRLRIQLRNKEITLDSGEFFIVPKGVEHRPIADEEVEILLFEPKTVVNTGNVEESRTKKDLEWI